jgi:predicted amidohydrolase YtcJ
MLNSAAVAQLGLDAGVDAKGAERDAAGRATGRLYRLDAWLRQRLPASGPPDLREVSRRLASFGVTGVTDATATSGPAEQAAFAAARARGELLQRVVMMGGMDLSASAAGGIECGAVKLVLAESELPALGDLVGGIAAAHALGRAAAIHCVTRAELWLALSAFAAAGTRAGDRIEHAAVAPPEAAAQLAALRLTVVTQPHFVRERGDAYARDVEPADRPWLYRARGLLDAGVPLGGGSDAPFGDPDPWRAMAAAVTRRSEGGRLLGPDESLTPERALALFTSPAQAPGAAPRRVAVGAPADLCLLSAPWREARGEFSAARVRATFCAGQLAWLREEMERGESADLAPSFSSCEIQSSERATERW